MIDEKKLAELRRLVQNAGDRFDFGGLPLPDLFDTIEALWKEIGELKREGIALGEFEDKQRRIIERLEKENAELKEDRELLHAYEELSMKQLAQIKKLESVALAAEDYIADPWSENLEKWRKALAALKENP